MANVMNKRKKLAKQRKEIWENKEWYTIRSLMGNDWAHWFFLIGARERGKSYSVQDYALNQKINKGVPFYWIRLNEASTSKMLQNNGAKMFEPLLVEKYGLNIKVKAGSVYNIPDETENGVQSRTQAFNGKLCDVFALSTAHNLKGAALYDKNTFKGCNIIVDEFQLEKSQKKTFDVVYQLKMLIENICRSNYENVRIFMIANNTEECSEILSEGFGFIPIEWGIYKLKSRNCVIDYIANNKAYEERRKKALANELEKNQSTGNFTNKIQRDFALVYKGRLHHPNYIIKFSKDQSCWFTVWDNNVVCPYNGEKKQAIAMKRYIDETYNPDMVNQVIEMNDVRCLKFRNLITQTRFYHQLESIKK